MKKQLLMSFLVVFSFCANVFAQDRKVTGKVTAAEDGSGLPGVSVQVKGSNKGSTSDANGNYSILVPEKGVLKFTFVGLLSKEVTLTSQSVINVELSSDARQLSEVVVTGTGSATSKRKLGISVESLTAENIPSNPSGSLDQALVGKIPGAQISSISGNPGDKVNIVLRGINSVQGGTRPMILLNGVEIPFENLNQLDMTQVERIEVVQGAASASLYGAQGANGVIQIFTKKGVKGRLSINASTSYSVNTFINAGGFAKANLHPYLTDASGNIISRGTNADLGYKAGDIIKIDPVTGIILGSNSLSYRFGTDIPGITPAPGGTASDTRYGILDPRNVSNQPYVGNLQYFDHFSQIFQSAPSRNNAISISGGSDKMDFSIAIANNNTASALLKDNGAIDRTNLTANIGMELFKDFTFRSITNLAYTTNNLHPNLGAPGGEEYGLGLRNANVDGVYGFLNTSPFFDLTTPSANGDFAAYQRASFASVNAFNPFYRLQYTKGDSKRYDIIQNFEANYNVNKFVSLVSRYGISFKIENNVWTYFNQSLNANSNAQDTYASNYNNTDNTGEINNFQYNLTKQNFYAGANFRFDLEKDFGLSIPLQSSTLVAFDYRKNDYKELVTRGLTVPLAPPINLQSTQTQNIAYDFLQPFVTYGYVLDQKFDYGNLFGVTAGLRTDYSSAFGAGSEPFTFPHFNGYLNLQNIKALGLDNFLSQFKVRAAYGKAGIQPLPFDRYPVLTLQQTGNEVTYTNQGGTIDRPLRNPDLNVEVSSETEIGTDIGINLSKQSNWFKYANVSLTFWRRSTDNAIYTQTVPPSTGASFLLTNAIALSSNGWQLGINIPVYYSKNFEWNFTGNFGHQTSVIDAVNGGDIPLTTNRGSTGLVLAAGRKIGQIYGYKALTNVSQTRAEGGLFIPTDKQGNYEIVDGRVVNKTTKAIYFSDEATPLGDPNPSLVSSFTNNFGFKNNAITFGFQFDWVAGATLYNQTREWMYRDGISADFAKPVTIDGKTGAYTAYYASAYYALGDVARGAGNNATKDYFMEDASFVRLRNISLGFDLSKFTNTKWLSKCQLVFSGRNLLTFTKYSGMDPEISSGPSNSAFDRGVDHNTIPNMRAYQVTLNLGF
jgi:TonB-dependent starch-binding outer membrane protein SusC